MNHHDIKSGMVIIFGWFLSLQPQFIPVLLRSFACFVFHSDALRDQMLGVTSHNFCKFQLLQSSNNDSLLCLKLLVTTDPTEGVMTVRIGIPPHVNQIV